MSLRSPSVEFHSPGHLESQHFRSELAMSHAARRPRPARDYVGRAESEVTPGKTTTCRAAAVTPNKMDRGRPLETRGDMQILLENRSRSPLSVSVSDVRLEIPSRSSLSKRMLERRRRAGKRQLHAIGSRARGDLSLSLSLHVGVLPPDFPVIIESRRSGAAGKGGEGKGERS